MKKLACIAAMCAALSGCATIATGGAPLPEPLAEFAYDNNEDFDIQLFSSLDAGLGSVRVDLPRGGELPKRLGKFAGAVKVGGGDVYQCETTTSEGLFTWAAVWKIAQVTARASAARNYHLVLETNSRAMRLDGVRFLKQDGFSSALLDADYGRCRKVG